MFNLLNALHIAAASVTSLLALMGSVFVQKSATVVMPTPQPQLAVIQIESSTSTDNLSFGQLVLPEIKPGLLPKVNKLSFVATATSSVIKKTTTVTPPVLTQKSPVPVVITPQWFLDNTVTSLNQNLDSSYQLSLITTVGSKKINWDLYKTSVGGENGIPEFTVVHSCDPLPLPPESPADTEIRFDTRSPYSCDITLTDQTGHVVSKRFSFTTGAGRLVVSTATGMDIILRDDKDDNGFVFKNDDSKAIALTGITFDVSFTALTTSTQVSIRFIDPKSGYILAEYPINNLPTNPLLPYTYATINANVGLNFNIDARTQKMLLVEAIGVHKTTFLEANPDIKVTLKKITTTSDAKQFFGNAVIDWFCQVDKTPYDQSAQKPSNVCTQ
ncbi:MAG: hypothetical protein KGJ89_02445 [Patescibacteria group bacterium]|nr:hypothetical protein [Patescibacteria group bacterium]MDE2015738.1 hypothetical protein [Patescibacteria group bacterium]MDE2226795.1 hypothetical protein [Patescibacteria group bacterium]